MVTLLNFESQEVEYDVSSTQHTPPTSSHGDNRRTRRDGNQQPAAAAIQNVEEAPPSASDDNVGVQDTNLRCKRKRHCYHSQQQVQEMESFFKDFPYPDEKQKRELANSLGLNSMQVKFWFQNKRAQMKAMLERHKNTLLIAENEKLRTENQKYNEALSNIQCLSCRNQPFIGEISFREQQLRLENARLKEEIAKMEPKIAGNFARTSFSKLPQPPNTSMPSHSLDVVKYGPQPSTEVQVHGGSSDPQRSIINSPFNEHEKAYIMELAIGAMEEFKKMAQNGAPLWIPGMDAEILNQQEYVRVSHVGLGPKPQGFRSEASRESMIVILNPSKLIEILMDVNQWSTMFRAIVASAKTTEILSNGVTGNYDGALQVISAEYHVLSHLVPTRDSYFLRYCKLQPDGAWVVVDVSLDYMRPNAATKCIRRPSSCMIQECPSGFSKVTWIEHVEVEDIVVHDLFKHLLNSGFSFGARKWIRTLDRQSERLAFTMALNVPLEDLSGINREGRKCLMKLTENIMQSYCNYIGASPQPAHVWTGHKTTPTSANDVRVMMRKHTDASGAIVGLVISATTSFLLPVCSQILFDFLRNVNSRSQWDILTNGFIVQELTHIASGRDPGNFVSLLHANSANPSESSKIIVQESCTDTTGSYLVYNHFEHDIMNSLLSGSNPDSDILLPSGFTILPYGPGLNGGPMTDVGSGWCLVTFAYQILVKENLAADHDIVSSLCNLMKCTIKKIQTAMTSVST